MNRKNMITILAVLAVVFTASAVLAGPGWGRGGGGGYGPGACGGPGGGYGYGPGYTRQAPALTPEQQEKYTALQQEHFTAMNDLRSEMQTRSAKLDALLADPKAARADVDKAIEAVNETRNKMFKERVDFQKKVADETGVQAPYGRRGRGGYGYQPCASGPGYAPGDCPGYGPGYGRGYGPGYHMGPRW